MHGFSRVLVTGGAGFIGSHTVDRLLTEGLEVVVLDDLRSGRLENINQHVEKKGFRFVRGDVRDSRLVRDLVKNVDWVVHLAALVSVPESMTKPILTNDVNVNGTLNLLKASVDFNVKRFVYASSCAVYGNAEVLPIKEDSPLKPLSPYGVSKVAAEYYARVFYEVYGLETVCLRYFNVYGQRQTYSDYSGVITKFIDRLTNDFPLVVFGDGEQTRDFVYVQDVVEANMLALKKEEAAGETFNIGTGVATKINQLATALLEITKKAHLKIKRSKPREGDIKHSFSDVSKARKDLHYNPKITLKCGLEELAQSYDIQE